MSTQIKVILLKTNIGQVSWKLPILLKTMGNQTRPVHQLPGHSSILYAKQSDQVTQGSLTGKQFNLYFQL